MSKRKSRRRRARHGSRSVPSSTLPDAPCDVLGVEDGIDPRILFRNHYREDTPAPPEHRARQLAGQAAQALRFALQEFDDPLLLSLDVVAVTAEAGGSALRVVVQPFDGPIADAREAERVLDRLDRVQGRLRSAVAVAIRRRRVPMLRFSLDARARGGER